MSLSFPRSTVILPFRYGIPSLGVRSNFPSSTVSSLELRCFSLQVRSSFPFKYGRFPMQRVNQNLMLHCFSSNLSSLRRKSVSSSGKFRHVLYLAGGYERGLQAVESQSDVSHGEHLSQYFSDNYFHRVMIPGLTSAE